MRGANDIKIDAVATRDKPGEHWRRSEKKDLRQPAVTLLVLLADSGYILNGAITPPLVTF